MAIGETYRTVAEQDALYAQGRTKPGNKVTNARGSSYSSQHQWGIAFDFYRADGKGAYNEDGDFSEGPPYNRQEPWSCLQEAIGKSIVDKPHVYLLGLGQRYWDFETEIRDI
ncbi:MAG: M15 family metallopeptidase [Clostridium fessum]